MVRFLKVALSSVAVAALLAGCASTESELQTKDSKQIAQQLRKVSEIPATAADTSPVQIKREVYVGASVSRNEHGDPLPAQWERGEVQFAKASGVSFQDIASLITSTTKIPVAIAAAPSAGGGAAAAGFASPGGERQGQVPVQPGSAPALGAALSAIPTFSGGSDLGIPGSMRLSYSGKLSGLLDLVAANFNVSWSYKDGRILFAKSIVRTFDVPALPIIAKLSFSMKSNSSSGESSSGSTGGATNTGSGEQNAETTGGFDLWADLQKTLDAIVAGDGTFNMSPQTGSITVNASPATVSRMADYLKQLNSQLSKQIALSVKVYSVELTDRDDYSSDMNLLFSKAGKYGLQLATPAGAGLSPTIPVIDPASGAQGLGWAILSGKLAGSSGIVQALADRGDVSVVTSASVTSLNGVPVPVQVAQTRGYAARVEVAQTDSGTSTSIEPGSVTTGFNLHLVPKIQRDGNLLLQYGMNISELVGAQNGFDVFSSGGSSIQLPNVTQRNFIQQAIIPNGSTLVLAGFEQVKATNQKTGNVHSGLWPFGGSRVSALNRQIIVIAITPTLLDMSARSVN